MIENYWPFWYGGPAIAVVALTILAIGGDYLAITRGYVSICSIITKRSYFHKPEIGGPFGFRTFFTIGVVLGGLAAALWSGGYRPSLSLGIFDQVWGSSIYAKAIVLTSGGFLWGYGSRMARGCTSGNSISGMSRGSLSSIVATICFMIGGVVTVHILQYFIRGN